MTVTLERSPPPPAPASPPPLLQDVVAPKQEWPTTQEWLTAHRGPKRPWLLRHPLAVGLAVLALLAMAIAIPLAVTTAKAPTVAIGQPLAFSGNGGLRASVTVVSVAKTAHPYVGTISEAAKNGVYAVADLAISVSSGSYQLSALNFAYQAANGRTYNAFNGNAWWAAYSPVAFTAGSTQVKVTFDVPAAGRDIQFMYPPGHVVGQWNLS